MKHKKVLVMTLIIGMSMHMMTVVTSAVSLDEEAEQQVIIRESQASIPVQGYIIPLEDEPEEPTIPEIPEAIEAPNYLEAKEVREIPDTSDAGKYYEYVIMNILSLLWVFMLLMYRKEKNKKSVFSIR